MKPNLLPQLTVPKFGWLPKIRYVQVATHSRCNADCVFCPYSESEHFKHPGMMKDETWHRILANLRPWTDSLAKFCPYLMQEPLIDKSIFAKIEDIYRCFPNIAVEVSTNGAALTEATAEKLFTNFKGRKHEIWVSHHGINEETLHHIMQIDYQKSTENLIRLLKMSDGRFKIRIRGAGRSKAVDKVYFTHQQYVDYWEEMFKKHSINRKNVSVDSFEFHDRAGTLFREDRGACELNKGKVRNIGPGHEKFHCSRIDEWVHFMHDGSMRLCCMDYHNEVKLPNINDIGLLDYFHSSEYRELVMKVRGDIESEENFICKRCTSPGG